MEGSVYADFAFWVAPKAQQRFAHGGVQAVVRSG
jgi:hypothetical protein